MTQNDVKRSQAEKIYNALFPPTNYLVRLRRRMNELAFPPDDPLFVLVCTAYEALNRLRNHAHTLSCAAAYGPPRPKEDDPPKEQRE